MTRERLYLFDTTLRDGAQTSGIDFSVTEKIAIAELLDRLGVDYVEGGYPGANPTDTEFFREKRTKRATFTAFGMTKRAGRSVANDPGVQMLLDAAADAICFVAKAWDYHVRVALGCSNEENLDAIRDSVEAAVAAGREAMVDCEHFFDGYKANPDYALACARTAHEAGARWVVLCDTNGGTLPGEVEAIVRAVTAVVPGANLGIHAHDDTGQAVANSLAAVNAGARQIQGTLNGIGERCGNANLITLIPTLMLKTPYRDRLELGIDAARLTEITAISHAFDEMLNRAPNRHAPYVGESAFATKAGIHASAILKEPQTYEHVPPEVVGNKRKVLVSDQAGKSNLLGELARLGVEVDKADPRLDRLLAEVKEREAAGYAYEAADASFELLARKALGKVPRFFDVKSFRVMVERRHNALGQLVSVSEAVVKVDVDGETRMNVSEGNGPVNALDGALRKDLGKYQSAIEGLELVDYKVRILDGGTGAVTRVLIESHDKTTHRRWFTIGVSSNIVDASFQALVDSITYALLKADVA
ncbi:citramalate synthase [Polymorphum gilvum]|uniref:Citramalate synthase n=1 Tax=Polymorphum gilvum (strain LMG 25793 / CGMCC 1.9160 / SL003B-26A1) TaxID=991905 RepID=F2J5A0_POLGS|nr:citramalate synthase [Polymorphum gilvum]ADZ71159.1 Putative isopropylmalate synthase (LeuA-like) [Polymorphum gilvum SL003B-26A1]